jgi:hypothetical protein
MTNSCRRNQNSGGKGIMLSRVNKVIRNNPSVVIPAKAGIQSRENTNQEMKMRINSLSVLKVYKLFSKND